MTFTIEELNALNKSATTNTEIAFGYNGLNADILIGNVSSSNRRMHYFKDFLETNELTGAFVTTAIGSSTAALSTSAKNGAVVMTTGSTSGNAVQIQAGGTAVVPTIDLQLGLKSGFRVKVNITNILALFSIGLIVTDTTISAGVTDGVFFRHTAANILELVVRASSTETTLDMGTTLVANQNINLAWDWDGVGTITAYKTAISTETNGVETVTDRVWEEVGTVTTNIPTAPTLTGGLAVSASVSTAAAVARVANLDYLEAFQERV